jgi:molecular chaperone IbpA
MAVAGFTEEEISLQSENNTLTVSAAKAVIKDGTSPKFLHQGIAERNFSRQFRLADHIKVISASMDNGLLHVELQREVPEAMKPRVIPVNGTSAQPLLKFA